MAADRHERRQAELAGPNAALVSYLDDLLHTATSTVTEEPAAELVAEAPSVPVPAPPGPEEIDDPDLRPAARPVQAAVPTPEPVAVRAAPQAAPIPMPVPEPPAPAEPGGRPEWADRPFECLLFRVAGLQLAVPLVLLGAIHRIEDRIKPIPGRPPWYLGMLPDRGVNLKVVDSAQWIMPGRVPPGALDGYRFVIRLDDSDWGLACDQVAESFTLDPGRVRWRSSRSKRPWLAGTVVQHMCALIDVGTMARLLARAEREHRLDLD